MGHGKGQAATEYMVTYAWVILTLAVVGVGLYYIGFPKVLPTDKGTQGFGEITLIDWALKADGEATFVLLNEASTLVDVKKISLTLLEGGEGGCSNTGSPLINDYTPGSSHTVAVSGCPLTASIGEYYRANISIEYVNEATSSESKSYGYAWGRVE
ncbi:MAG: hypothetical protein GF334_09995 [Candidatus Altiarchaeales archaeon]|nr:hypothetical protein [Candidatus Altiarchaeales archaeon]